MVNQQLLEYVRAQRTAGLSKEAIIKAAAAGGWTSADLEEIFAALDGTAKPAAPVPPPPPPPPPPAAQPQSRVITPPPQPAVPTQAGPVGQSMPQTPPPQPMAVQYTPLGATPRPMAAPGEIMTVKKRRIWPYVLSGVLVLLVALALAIEFYIWPTVSELFAPTPAELNTPPLQPIGNPSPINTDTTATDTSQLPTPFGTAASSTATSTVSAPVATSTATSSVR